MRRLLALLVLISAASLGGCSTFDRDWEAMAQTPAGAGIEGRWSGIWYSAANGHSGGLRCMLTADESGTLTARYRATYAGFLSFEYTMPMAVREEDGAYHFAAEADLGWLAGGRYEYAGTVAGDEFTSTYDCDRDHGTFRMTRVR
jgi:hypothetical protein